MIKSILFLLSILILAISPQRLFSGNLQQSNYSSKDLFNGQSLDDDPVVKKIKKFEKTESENSGLGERSELPNTVQYLPERKELYEELADLPDGLSGAPAEISVKLNEKRLQDLEAVGSILAFAVLFIFFYWRYRKVPNQS